MKCNKCGTENPKGKSVCMKCGNFLYSSNPNNRVQLTPQQKRSRRAALVKNSTLGCLWMTLLITGLFIVLGILIFLIVKYVLPEDFFAGMVGLQSETSETINPGETTLGTTIATLPDTTDTAR
jgi:uncharacterized membrane protein YvbJ